MSGFTVADLKKAFYYFKRNGLRDTYLAALDRFTQKKGKSYTYEPPAADVLHKQRGWSREHGNVKFSLLVPAYRTPKAYLTALLESVQAQTYENWELILADAGAAEDREASEQVRMTVEALEDERIRYLRLSENGGISENTNAALAEAGGAYIGLLDHDDLLTPDALYEMAREIKRAEEAGVVPRLLYSDEDKCGEDGCTFYDLHEKPDFDLDLLLSNNYVCHFTVLEAALMKKLGFRSRFDGAQDHDLVLRAAGELLLQEGRLRVEPETQIRHIPRVLYHWRCHSSSTAANPRSKQYAYEAGRRAIEAFLESAHISGTVSPTPHLGFFRVDYSPDVLTARADVGILGGKPLDRKNRVTGVLENGSGSDVYAGLRAESGGYFHRAQLQQDMRTVDVRLMRIAPALYQDVVQLLEEMGVQAETDGTGQSGLRLREGDSGRQEEAYRALSRELCSRARQAGYRVMLDPAWKEKIR